MVKEMSAIAQGFIKGAGCTVVVNKSADSSMNKGTKNNRNPFLGRVMLKKTYSGFVMGTDYKRSVENTAERIGNEGAKAELKTVWHKPVTGELGEWFSTDKRTESKFYLKLQRNEKQVACKVETEFFLDGRKATDAEVEIRVTIFFKLVKVHNYSLLPFTHVGEKFLKPRQTTLLHHLSGSRYGAGESLGTGLHKFIRRI